MTKSIKFYFLQGVVIGLLSSCGKYRLCIGTNTSTEQQGAEY